MGCGSSRINKTTATSSYVLSMQAREPEKEAFLDNFNELDSGVNCFENDSNIENEAGESKRMTIIHFNDVYNIEPHEEEPVGGAPRFATKIAEMSCENPLILFSGDCLNPSLMSTVTRGRQMIPIFNKIGVHVGLYGNHDFDFGVDELIEFKNQTTFPWLLSNVIDNISENLLAEGVEKITMQWGGKKIGIIGLVEEEWLVTLATVDPRDVTYYDFVDTGKRLAAELRREGADLIIALTHMRMPNDEKLLRSDANIDLILGGHDHHYVLREENGKTLVKSGSDFRSMSKISIVFDENSKKLGFETQKIEINSSIEEDNEVKTVTKEFLGLIEDRMEADLGTTEVDLDGRFSIVRTQESNLGNFITDVMRMAMQTDIALLNGGTLRSDRIHAAGDFKLKDLISILPMMDILVVLAVPGETLLKVLENGVSEFPKHEGRFLQVSGVKFSFNPDLPPGQRILRNSVKVNGEILDWKHEYRVCVKSYLANGKDGFNMLRPCKKLVDEENGSILPTIVQNHFESMKIVSGLKKSDSKHKQSVLMQEDVGISDIIEKDRCRMIPKVEGRIRVANFENGNQEMNVNKQRPGSPKPRGRTSRLISLSAPTCSLVGLAENAEDDKAKYDV